MSKVTKEDICDKIEWEGSLYEVLTGGWFKAEDIEDPELATKWVMATEKMEEMNHLMVDLAELLGIE